MESEGELVSVHLLGLPLRAREQFEQHLQDLTRELSLVQIGVEGRSGAHLPPRLLQIAVELNTTYAAFRAEPDAVVNAAVAAGQEHCDVTYVVPPSAALFLRGLGEVLDEADAFCRSQQHLLSLPASQEVVAYRRWVVAEADRQLAGEAPRSWRALPWREHDAGPVADATARAAAARVAAPASRDRPPGVADDPPRGPASDVVGEPLVLESVAGSVASARRYVRARLRQLDAGDLEESAELGVSELVTNAVLHARTAVTCTVRTMGGRRIRIEVTDSSPRSIRPRRAAAASSTTGRGLQLVTSVSSDWGVRELPADLGPGKTVWFEPRRSGSVGPQGLEP